MGWVLTLHPRRWTKPVVGLATIMIKPVVGTNIMQPVVLLKALTNTVKPEVITMKPSLIIKSQQ